jgi:hypothetical protein
MPALLLIMEEGCATLLNDMSCFLYCRSATNTICTVQSDFMSIYITYIVLLSEETDSDALVCAYFRIITEALRPQGRCQYYHCENS